MSKTLCTRSLIILKFKVIYTLIRFDIIAKYLRLCFVIRKFIGNVRISTIIKLQAIRITRIIATFLIIYSLIWQLIKKHHLGIFLKIRFENFFPPKIHLKESTHLV